MKLKEDVDSKIACLHKTIDIHGIFGRKGFGRCQGACISEVSGATPINIFTYKNSRFEGGWWQIFSLLLDALMFRLDR